MELQRREQKHLEEQQEEINKWQKKLQDRQREDEEFKVRKIKLCVWITMMMLMDLIKFFLLFVVERTNEKETSFIVKTKFS